MEKFFKVDLPISVCISFPIKKKWVYQTILNQASDINKPIPYKLKNPFTSDNKISYKYCPYF